MPILPSSGQRWVERAGAVATTRPGRLVATETPGVYEFATSGVEAATLVATSSGSAFSAPLFGGPLFLSPIFPRAVGSGDGSLDIRTDGTPSTARIVVLGGSVAIY